MNGNVSPNKNYLLITPCKNEGKNLPSLIKSVKSQTVKPLVWLILDDGSTDDTEKILKECQKTCDWIKTIRFEEHSRNLGPHLAEIMRKGFNSVTTYCNKRKLQYSYVGNLDGDLTIPPTFFENIIEEFEKNPRLGVASGGTEHIIGNRIVRVRLAANEPSGGHMLIRRECFENIGGFPISYASDSVLKAKARLRNWETKRFENNVATEVRDVGSAEGFWKGSVQSGKSNYYLNFNPFFVIMKSANFFKKPPHYIGFGYLFGYFRDFIRRKSQIEDEEIKKYFWSKWSCKDLRKLLIKRYLFRNNCK